MDFDIRLDLLSEAHKCSQVAEAETPSISASICLREYVDFFHVDSEGQEAGAHLRLFGWVLVAGEDDNSVARVGLGELDI